MYEWIGKIPQDETLMRRISVICEWVPRPVILALCRVIAYLIYSLADKRLKCRIVRNMSDLLSNRHYHEIEKYSRKYYYNLVITFYEILIDSYRLERTSFRRFTVIGEENLEEILQLGRGAIVYSPHAGNFFYYYWYLTRRYPCLTIATSGSPELRPLYMKFYEMGCDGLDYDNTPPLEMLRSLKKHLANNGIVFILGDFWRPAFPLSEFFGRLTRSPEGAAMLSIEQRVPVVPFYGGRLKGFTHRLVFERPMFLYEQYQRSQRSEATNQLNRFMEQVICCHPDQWFYWFNADERWEVKNVII